MAHAAVVGGAEDRLELRGVQARDDDLLRHADADAEDVGELEQHGQPFERFVERLPVVGDGVDVELRLTIGGMQGDVEVFEARLQDLQREARIGQGAEVRRHAEAGEADALGQLHVVEQLRMDGRLAAGEEEHVEVAGGVEDHLARRIGAGHRPMGRIELLDAEDALAVAGAGAADVQDAQVLVTRTALGLEAEADAGGIRRLELGEQRVDVDPLAQQFGQSRTAVAG